MSTHWAWDDFWNFYNQETEQEQKDLLTQLYLDKSSPSVLKVILKDAPESVKVRYNGAAPKVVKSVAQLQRELNRILR